VHHYNIIQHFFPFKTIYFITRNFLINNKIQKKKNYAVMYNYITYIINCSCILCINVMLAVSTLARDKQLYYNNGVPNVNLYNSCLTTNTTLHNMHVLHRYICIIFCLTPLPLQIKYIILSMSLLVVISVFVMFEVFVKIFILSFIF
jgi:hypothetical protein